MDMKDDELRISLKFLTGELMKAYSGTILANDVEKVCKEIDEVQYGHDVTITVSPIVAGLIFDTVSATNIVAECINDECRLIIRASRSNNKVDIQYEHFMNRFDFFVRDMKDHRVINMIHLAFGFTNMVPHGTGCITITGHDLFFVPEPYRSILNVCSIGLDCVDIRCKNNGNVSVNIGEARK